MAGINNNVVFGEGMKITPTSARSLLIMQQDATDVGGINYTGNPEGAVAANPSSLCHDPVSGSIYKKSTGTGNTGWQEISTLSVPVTVPNGGTGVSSTTSYGVVCGGTTSTAPFQNAGAGLSGQILRSGGASALPAYSTATYPDTAGTSGNILSSNGTNFVSSTNTSVGASLVLISNQTASASATIDFTNISIDTYRKYLLFFRGVIPATDGSTLRMQGSINNGSSWIVTTYQSGCNSNDYNSATITNTNSTTDWVLTPALDNGFATSLANGLIEIYTNSANHCYTVGSFSCFNNTTGVSSFGINGGRLGTNGANAFRMIMSAGNITSGVFQLFGVLGA